MQNGADATTAVEFKNVDILFPKAGERVRAPSRDPSIKKALALLDGGADRARIATETGVVLGSAGANMTVKKGEISVLMGLSGSGKSTLLRAANGLNAVTRGEVLVRHGDSFVDVASCNAETLRDVRRKSIAMVFQQFGLLPWRSVRDNVGLGLEFQGIDKAERRRIVEEKLELVGLSDWADRKVAELSGGMQQRVGLARAFATDADILLMDEPFSALDPLIRSRLQDELISLQESVHKTIIFVSHDLDEALKLGDTITIMQNGRIIQTGAAEDIVLRPATDYVAEFVRHMNPLSVLTGETIMRRLADLPAVDGMFRLDKEGRIGLTLDADDRPDRFSIDGAECEPILVEAETPLSHIIRLLHAGPRPVLVTAGGRVVGIAAEAEILKALAPGAG